MTRTFTRREFLGTAAAGAALASVPLPLFAQEKSANEKLNIAIVGCGNKGWHNVEQLRSQNIVALCDVDTTFLDKAAAEFPKAVKYRDYRQMLDKEHKSFDAVVVSTADHTHAGPTAQAITMGKHVYCEKPLTHTVKEARHVAQLAAKHKCVTQMGTQIHADDNYRRVVEIVLSGTLGTVSDVYTWCNRGWQNGRFVESKKPAPANLDWNLWLGPAKERPYCEKIHPQNWRRFWEYGSGTFGDMACHIMDLPFWALKLRHPTSVVAEGPEVHPDGAAEWCLAKYEFPARGDLPAINLYWADGGKHQDIVKNTKDYKGKSVGEWGLGILFVGDKGMLVANYGSYQLLPQEKFKGFAPPKPTIPNSVGHWNEWVKACKSGEATTCNFDYSGALAETVLLGVAAYRCGKKLEWDAKNLKVKNTDAADKFLTKEYRKGWAIAGMA